MTLSTSNEQITNKKSTASTFATPNDWARAAKSDETDTTEKNRHAPFINKPRVSAGRGTNFRTRKGGSADKN
jgi:hypothetical protein